MMRFLNKIAIRAIGVNLVLLLIMIVGVSFEIFIEMFIETDIVEILFTPITFLFSVCLILSIIYWFLYIVLRLMIFFIRLLFSSSDDCYTNNKYERNHIESTSWLSILTFGLIANELFDDDGGDCDFFD